jgi:hypothetical protein
MSSVRSLRRRVARRRVIAASVTATMAVGLFATVAPTASAAICPTTVTDLGAGRFEIRFTSTEGTCDWSVPEGVTKLEALLVGSGGSGLASYAGGGGDVVIVDLTGTTGAVAITVGAADDGAGRDTELVDGVTTHTAAGGGNGENFCGGTSGNGNEGYCDSEGADGGGGAGGDAPATPGVNPNWGDGGPGLVVDDLAGAGSLFDGVTECFGGGGAAAFSEGSFDQNLGTFVIETFVSNTAGCGGGLFFASGPFPKALADFTVGRDLPENSGGGGPAIYGGAPNEIDLTGSDGVAVVRYEVPVPGPGPQPGPDPTPEPEVAPTDPAAVSPEGTLPATGLSSGDAAGLGILLTGAGVGVLAYERRLRAAHR